MKHVGLEDDLDFLKRYHTILRDYMYIEETPQLFHFDFLIDLSKRGKTYCYRSDF